jgi:hypothetical protein
MAPRGLSGDKERDASSITLPSTQCTPSGALQSPGDCHRGCAAHGFCLENRESRIFLANQDRFRFSVASLSLSPKSGSLYENPQDIVATIADLRSDALENRSVRAAVHFSCYLASFAGERSRRCGRSRSGSCRSVCGLEALLFLGQLVLSSAD